MNIDIDKLTEAELVDLNNRIVERLRFLTHMRAHAQMLETLAAAMARVVARPQVVIAGAAQKIADGRLVDEASLKFCLDAIDDLLAEIRLIERAAA